MDAKERRRLLRKRAVRRQVGLIVAAAFVIGLSIYFVSSITSARAQAKEEKAKKEAQIAKEEAKEAAVNFSKKEHEKSEKYHEALIKKIHT